jgi:hypothetical protein
MSKTRLLLLAVTGAMLALCAGYATSASASTKFGWFVAGKELKGGENDALASTAKLDSSFLLNAPAVSLKLSCPIYKTGKTALLGGVELTYVESDKYEECNELSPSTCKLQPPPVIGPRPSYNIWYLVPGKIGNEWRLRLTLTPPRLVASIAFEGSCALAGEQLLTGSYTLAAPTLGSEESAQLIEGLGTVENNSLEIDGVKAYIEGDKQLLKLSTGSKWSFHS